MQLDGFSKLLEIHGMADSNYANYRVSQSNSSTRGLPVVGTWGEREPEHVEHVHILWSIKLGRSGPTQSLAKMDRLREFSQAQAMPLPSPVFQVWAFLGFLRTSIIAHLALRPYFWAFLPATGNFTTQLSRVMFICWCFVIMKVCVCVGVESPESKGISRGHPSHHWWMATEEANDESCKRTCELLTSDMARWLSHKPPLPTWHGNITWHDFISSHFILSLRGASKCVFHKPGSLIKCRGGLVVRPPRIPDYFQNFPDIMLPEAYSAQASRRCLSELF